MTSNPQVTIATEYSQVPNAASEVVMHEAYAKSLGQLAYIWGWALVNMRNRRLAFSQVPYPGRLNGVLPAAPTGQITMLSDYIDPGQTFIACPNQDVVYGLGFFALDKQPVVIQIPDVGDRFWVVAAYDQRTDQITKLGKQYGTEPGFYLLAGPNWEGSVPTGIKSVLRSSTELGCAIPRLFMDDTDADRAALQPLIDQIAVYPLSEFDGTMKTIDWSEVPSFSSPDQQASGAEVQWVFPEKFFDQLPDVLASVPPLPGEEALYDQFRTLLEVAANNPAIKQALVDVAIETENEVINPFLRWEHNGIPTGNGWNRSVNQAEWGTDYFCRTATARSNLFENVGRETAYLYTDNDSSNEPLHGKNLYALTFAADELPPVQGFWSLTLYNKHHFFFPNDLNRYSLGTKNKTLQYNDDGSLTLYAGATSPGSDKASNWLPAPTEPFSLYLRAYWPDEVIADGSWQPPVISKL